MGYISGNGRVGAKYGATRANFVKPEKKPVVTPEFVSDPLYVPTEANYPGPDGESWIIPVNPDLKPESENIVGQVVRTINANSSGTPIWDHVNFEDAGADLGDVDVAKSGQTITHNTNEYSEEALDQIVELGENIILNNPTISTTTAVAGGVAIVTLHYGDIAVNLEEEYYTLSGGSINLNDLHVPAPTLYYVWIELVGGVPTVKKSTTSPHVPGVECEYAFISTCLFESTGGVATIYFARRCYNSNYNQMHHIGDYDVYMNPNWIEGMGVGINPASGEVSVASGYALRLTRDLVYDAVMNGTLLLDDETTVANLEAIATYSDGSPITGGRYHKLLVGAVVARAGTAYQIRVLRQDLPTVEYATLEEARIDAEKRAQTSFGSDWRANIVPIYYVCMLVGDASDLSALDIRESGVTGGGGGGSITVEKIVFVDATGAGDFITIDAAVSSVPNQRGMIISLMGGQNHDISSSVDVRGVRFQFGGGPSRAIIRAQAGGVLIIGGTTFIGINIQVPAAFADAFFLDAQEQLSNFEAVLFQPDVGKSIIGCSIPGSTFIGAFQLCGQDIPGGFTGEIMDSTSTWGVPTMPILYGTYNNLSPLSFGAFDVTSDGIALFNTTGTITGLPSGVLYVAPGEDIQARLDSLVNGGEVVLLDCDAGQYHEITDSLIVTQSNTKIRGIGNAVIRAQIATWTGGLTLGGRAPAAIEIGVVDGAGPVTGCNVSDIKFELEPPMTGVRINGGLTNFVDHCDLHSTGPKTVALKHAGIEILDSAAAAVADIILTNNIIDCDAHANRWINAINASGLVPMGFGNGISGFAASGNYGADIDDTLLYCLGVVDSTLYVDGAWTIGKNGGTGVIYMKSCNRVQVTEMSITASNHANTPGIVLEDSTQIQVYGNTIFGDGTNFLNGVQLKGNSDNNIIFGNVFHDITTGIDIAGAGCAENKIGINEYISVTTDIADVTTDNFIVGYNRYGAGNPNVALLKGHFGDCFYDGTGLVMWKCVSYPYGTSWRVI